MLRFSQIQEGFEKQCLKEKKKAAYIIVFLISPIERRITEIRILWLDISSAPWEDTIKSPEPVQYACY